MRGLDPGLAEPVAALGARGWSGGVLAHFAAMVEQGVFVRIPGG